MTIETLTAFFMWCSIIGVGVYALTALMVLAAPDFIYRLQTQWLPLPRETYNAIIFSFMGAFKLALIVFVIAPYLSLLIIA